jgi:hypothetical protein
LTLGIGLGDKDRCDYEKFGESADNRILAERLDESLDIITVSGQPSPSATAGNTTG